MSFHVDDDYTIESLTCQGVIMLNIQSMGNPAVRSVTAHNLIFSNQYKYIIYKF
jgi:hypothetical protein